MTREYEYMLGQDMRELYIDLLTQKDAPVKMRCQVLRNMLMYLMEEEARMIKADQECKFSEILFQFAYPVQLPRSFYKNYVFLQQFYRPKLYPCVCIKTRMHL